MHVFAKNKYTLQGLEENKIKIAMVQSSAAYALAKENPGVYEVSVPREAYILPRVLVASKGMSRRKMKMVLEFIRYAISSKVIKGSMEHGHSDGYFWPVTANCHFHRKELPDARKLDISTLDPARWGALEATINNWFSGQIVNR